MLKNTHVPVAAQVVAAHGLYIHSLPGRLRVEVPHIKGSSRELKRLEGSLRSVTGVADVEGSTLTGRMLVKYDRSHLNEDQVLNLMMSARDLPRAPQENFVANTVMGSIADFLVSSSLSLLVG